MADNRSYSNNNFMVDIDGWAVGYTKKFDGGGMVADIAEHKLGPDIMVKKNVANIKWEPCSVEVGMGMGKGMYDWMKASMDKGYISKNGAVTTADFNHKAQTVMTFSSAIMTEIGCPKLDGADKNNAYFNLKFQPETVRWSKGAGDDIRAKIGPKQKAWLCSNFRVTIGSLPCARVATVDAWVWKCSVAPDQIGIHREPTYHPCNITVPDLKLTISHADYQPWAEAAKKWFVDGFHTEDCEMTGSVEFLDPTMKNVLGEVALAGVGFKEFKEDPREGGSDKISRFNVTLYVESMKFNSSLYDA